MKTWIYSIVIVVAVLLLGSFVSNFIMNHHHTGHFSVLDKAAATDSMVYDYGVSSVKHLAHIDTSWVHENGREFAILNRTSEITGFACTECHNEPLKELEKHHQEMGKKSHWNIELQHANSETMNCTLCHDENNMDQLQTLTKQPITFDQSYKLCAQCHQMEYKDWAGGAHGKRVGGWAKPVVKNTCVNCHNPHSPSFPHKFPSRLNSRMIEQRQ